MSNPHDPAVRHWRDVPRPGPRATSDTAVTPRLAAPILITHPDSPPSVRNADVLVIRRPDHLNDAAWWRLLVAIADEALEHGIVDRRRQDRA